MSRDDQPKDGAWLEIMAELGLPLAARVLLRQCGAGGTPGKVIGGLVLVDRVDFAGEDRANDDQVWEAEIVLRRRLKVHGDTFGGQRLDQVMTAGGLCISQEERISDFSAPPRVAAAPEMRPTKKPPDHWHVSHFDASCLDGRRQRGRVVWPPSQARCSGPWVELEEE